MSLDKAEVPIWYHRAKINGKEKTTPEVKAVPRKLLKHKEIVNLQTPFNLRDAQKRKNVVKNI